MNTTTQSNYMKITKIVINTRRNRGTLIFTSQTQTPRCLISRNAYVLYVILGVYGHSFRTVFDVLGYHGYFWGPDWAEKTYRDFRYWDHFFQIFGKSVFTWLHGGHISVPKQWNGRHIGFPNKSCGSWTLFFCKKSSFVPINLHRCWPRYCSVRWITNL